MRSVDGAGKASRDGGLKQAVLCGQRCDCAMDGVRRGGQLRVYSQRVRVDVFTARRRRCAPLVAYQCLRGSLRSLGGG